MDRILADDFVLVSGRSPRKCRLGAAEAGERVADGPGGGFEEAQARLDVTRLPGGPGPDARHGAAAVRATIVPW